MDELDEIRKNEKLLLEAIKVNDTDLLDDLLHEDLLFVTATGTVITKDIDMANYRSGQIQIELIESSEQSIHLIGNTAVVTVKIRLKGKYLTYTIDENLQFIRIWIHHSGVWKIIGGSSVKM